MTDAVLGLRFTADQRELQQAADKGTEAVRRVGEESKKSNEQAARAAQQHTDALKRQADTLGMSRSQVMAYEAAQHKMTEAQRQSVQQSISAIDAYEKKQAALGRMSTMANAAGAAFGVALVAGIKASITAAGEAEQSQLRLDAVLRATRNSAGLNSDELNAMSRDMQNRLGINDEAVKDSMAVLLTFREVTRESFGEAMEVAANLSAVMQTDLKSAVMQLGKALENPEQGLTALTRSGISFNAAQKAMIQEMAETGRKAEAITMILQVMRQQGLNGVAEAMNTGVVGANRNFSNSWDDLLETIGKSDPIMKPVIGTIDAITKAVRTLEQAVEGGVGDAFLSFATFGLYTPDPKRAAPTAQANAWGGDDRDAGIAARRVEANRDRANEYLKQFRSDNEKLGDEIRKFRALAAAAGMGADEVAAGEARIRAKTAKKGSADSTAGRQLINSLTEQLAQGSGEATVFDKVMRQVTSGVQKFTEAEIAAALAIAGEIDERKRAVEQAKISAEAYDRNTAAQEQAAEVTADFNRTQSETIKNLQFETQLQGLSNTEREVAIAMRKLENDYTQASVQLQGEENAAYALRLASLRAIYEQQKQALPDAVRANADGKKAADDLKKAQEDARENQKRFNDDLARGLTDSIFRGFEGGKGFARNFWDSLKNMAKTTILQPVVKFLLAPVTGAVGGALGGLGIPGMANAGTGGMGSAFNSLANPILSSAGLFSGAGSYATALGLSSSAAGSQAALLAAQTGEFGLAGLAGTASSAGAGAMSGMLTAAPYVGAALLAYSMFKKSKTPATFTGMDASGTITRQGLSGGQFFGNDANQGYRWQTTDHWATDPFNAHVKTMFDELEKVGKKLGLDTSSLNTASVGFSASGLSNTNSQQIADEMAAQLGAVSDSLALQLMPNLKEFAQANETLTQTLVRLAEAQRQVDLQEIFGSMQGALKLADETRGLWLSDLSPLTAQQRLAEASGRYGETLSAAQGGDLQAMGQLSGMARTYLGEARGYYASSGDYTDIFNQVQGEIGNLVEDTLVEQSMAFSEMNIPLAQIADNTKDMDKRIAAALEAAIAARGEANDAAVKAQTEALIRANEDLARTLQSFIDARVLQ